MEIIKISDTEVKVTRPIENVIIFKKEDLERNKARCEKRLTEINSYLGVLNG